MATHPPRIERVGDAALLLVLGDELDAATNARARRIARDLAEPGAGPPGLGAPVAGHASVLVPFDPDVAAEEAVRALLASAAAEVEARPLPDGVLHEVPVRYGGADGPDLAEVARRCGLSPADVVEAHAGVEYRVMVVGFVPGFPYLAGLPARLELPRHATPRVRVPPGSVGIAGRQCGIYPFETSGGWHLLGRTTAPIWQPRRDPPALLAPGDRVRFVPA